MMNFEAFKDLTRIEQTLFGLPFIFAGALLAWVWGDINLSILWVFPAFMMARISGMAFNQLIDHKIDANNPRTKHRAIPSGRVTQGQARLVAWGSLALFLIVCSLINTLCLFLAPFAAFLLFIYSYMKRIHASCHFVLGLIHLLGPIMAATAISGHLSWPPFFLGVVAFFLISGTDIVYAIQDYEFDCAQGLQSIPALLGVQKSLLLSMLLHVASLTSMVFVGISAHFPIFYYLVILIATGVFFHFHTTIRTQCLNTGSVRGIESVFFFINVIMSSLMFLFILVSVLWRALL